MDEIDLSKLPKKERKKLKREMEREEQAQSAKKGTMTKWFALGVVVVLILVGSWLILKEISKPLPGQVVEDQGRGHVTKEEWSKFTYNSNPPTSGPHDATWIKPGVYNEQQEDGYLVHSLEHGYAVISYKCEEGDASCLSFVEQLKVRVNKDSYKLILVPRPNMDANFALTAWTRIDTFNTQEATLDRVEQFIRAFRNKGPEQTME